MHKMEPCVCPKNQKKIRPPKSDNNEVSVSIKHSGDIN